MLRESVSSAASHDNEGYSKDNDDKPHTQGPENKAERAHSGEQEKVHKGSRRSDASKDFKQLKKFSDTEQKRSAQVIVMVALTKLAFHLRYFQRNMILA